ncbi:cerebellar degeneration-related protein 2-like [Brienomyrus brachyistius]|uniref:cerebellar degeneration-related protein 2-like n=1 Tax=Brienomyrus brachyistius TaxID=42636 RepID=UPI0020B2A33F|nr:cerebellar degeneration-related protein 2-like [Brienomyrus brachyistius]
MEQFEAEEDEPWYDQQDLEQDLYLAAELGKTLLERNREMEDSLQEMYLTNEEQVREIEYLSKQVEILRETNEQHAKVYEQLDASAHKLELTNQTLVLEGKTSQQKIDRLTGTMETLQAQVDSLTARVEELRSMEQLRARGEWNEKERSRRSFPCLQELCSPRHKGGTVGTPEAEWHSLEEENAGLREVVAALQAAICAERARREGAQREFARVLQESAHLEERLLVAEGCMRHVQELEVELRELRELGGADGLDSSGVSSTAAVLGEERAQAEGAEVTAKGGVAESVHKSCSDTALNSMGGRYSPGRKPGGYGPRANGLPGQGVSILREVDEQYHTLLERYEDLLGKCRRGHGGIHHAGVQTSRPVSRDPSARDCASLAPPASPEPPETACEHLGAGHSQAAQNPPEYKALFKEIFSHIQKTKSEAKSPKKTKSSK